MKYKTLWTPQPEAFIKSLAPDPRQEIRRAIKQLGAGKTAGLDLRMLEGQLQGYMRFRIRTYRVVYSVSTPTSGPTITLVAAGPRSTIYETVERLLAEQMGNL